MTLTYRRDLTRILTTGEMDGNFDHVIDSANQSFVQSGSGAQARTVQDRLRDTVHVTDHGIVGDGATTEDFGDLQTYLATLSRPIRLVFPAKDYVIGALVDLDLPDGSVVDAYGAYFEAAHNGVLFDLNPDATDQLPITVTTDTWTKRNITWMGGQFVNTNATKTASVAFQAYFMRVMRFKDVRIGSPTDGDGFYAGFKFGAKDTYRFIDCYTVDCIRHYWVPAAGVLFTTSLTGNDLIDPEWRGCHMAGLDSNAEAGIYFENRAVNFKMNGGSINGTGTVAGVRFSDNSSLYSRSIAFNGVHFEQIGIGSVTAPAVLFTAGGTQGHYNISFDGACEFASATTNWRGVTLNTCRNVKFGSVLFGHSAAAGSRAGYGVHVDSNSRSVRFAGECNFLGFLDSLTITNCDDNGSGLIRVTSTDHGMQTGDRVVIKSVTGTTEANAMWVVTSIDDDNFDLQSSTFANAYSSGGAATLLNAIEVAATSVRINIQLEPEVIGLSSPVFLASYGDAAKSTFTEATVNMSTEFSQFIATAAPQTWLWPKGYDLHVRANDSGSAAAAAGAVFARVKKTGTQQQAGITVYLAGVTNDEKRANSGHVVADNDGNIGVTVTATGVGTLDLGIGISGIRQ